MREDPDIVKIRNFVTKCLESVGAIVEFTEYDYAEVVIPDEYARHFDGRNYFNLSFDFDVAKHHEDSEFVTYGGYFLDKVMELATQKGLACKRHISDPKIEIRNLPDKIKGKIAFRNCRINFVANIPVIYHYILFNFKVSYISDEREDRIVKILVNLNTGQVDDNMLKAVESVIFTDDPHTNYTVENMLSIEEAYKIATNNLEERIQSTIHDIRNKIDERLVNEKNRIMEYYNQIDDELNLKRKKLEDAKKTEGISSIDDKLRLSQIERQRRLNEIDEKNSLNVSILLFNAILISQTKIRNRYTLTRGKAERDIYITWNSVLNDVDTVVCEICHGDTMELELCSNSHIGCTRCIPSCSVCGVRLCTNCSMTRCSVCGEALCDKCKIVCENCGDVLCKNHIDFCTCRTEKRRKEKEVEEKIKEKQILKFQNISLNLSKSMKGYHDEYVSKNVDVLNEDWIISMLNAQKFIYEDDKIKAREVLNELNQKYPPNPWVRLNLFLSYERWSDSLISLGEKTAHRAPKTAL
ncbi:hypothetical protein FJZ33_07065, partial [Candidatus Poribacteria bacterium]|nr:hypothetical protein [Candidatus Poribacteria bacterium]